MMERLAPVENQRAFLGVGGGSVFDAEDVRGVQADTPDIVRVYATTDSLFVVGMQPGKVTLKLILRAGDMFYFDVVVTNDPPERRALLVGEPFSITYDGVQEYGVGGEGLTATMSPDGTHLVVTGSEPGSGIVKLIMLDGSFHTVDFVILGGQRLL